jgi:hypothetical protein
MREAWQVNAAWIADGSACDRWKTFPRGTTTIRCRCWAATLFDFTRRAMPWTAPKSLTNDEVYAVTAHILRLNGIIGDNDVIDAKALQQVKMPNRDGFIPLFPGKH